MFCLFYFSIINKKRYQYVAQIILYSNLSSITITTIILYIFILYKYIYIYFFFFFFFFFIGGRKSRFRPKKGGEVFLFNLFSFVKLNRKDKGAFFGAETVRFLPAFQVELNNEKVH